MSERPETSKDDLWWAGVTVGHWLVGLLSLLAGVIIGSWRLIAAGAACWLLTGLIFVGTMIAERAADKN